MSMHKLDIQAAVDNLPVVTEFIEKHLAPAGCSVRTRNEILIAAEEIFVNIASYAYSPDTGNVIIGIGLEHDPLTAVVTFADRGIPYDPTAKADPDISLPASEREIGGLGIFMTRKIMDEVTYEHINGCNVLTLRKHLTEGKDAASVTRG